LRIGHRGAAAMAPENTLASFAAAVEVGVDLVEFDVVQVRGELLLGHSPEELASERGTLDDALGFLAEAGCGAHVDVKSAGIEEEILASIRRHGLEGRAFVSSTDPPVLRRFAALAPVLPRARTWPHDRFRLSTRPLTAPLADAALRLGRTLLPHAVGRVVGGAGATVASLHQDVVTRAAVERAHAHGYAVVVWTVNDPARLAELAGFGVDALVSDDPRIFAATLTA
jgi:glycerophosphoryl diester phosphodiesterase